MAKRIQRKRTKGWRMPEGAVYVGRPTRWGNPFTVDEYGEHLALFNFRGRVQSILLVNPNSLDELRGKDLACWCKEGAPCHADILLELANAQATASA